jgi:diguanylate cyclase (GGDEF)-like protein
MILPETELEGAMLLAERLRVAVSEMALPGNLEGLKVTCSLGTAERVLEDRDGGALLGRADGALYQAKMQGRNRVVAARRRR